MTEERGKTVKETGIIMARTMMPQDANPAGNVHGGVIMKYIDDAGGVVALRHARTNVVTASIDRLDMRRPVFVGELVTFKASANLVGRTSMEVGVRVESENLISGEVRHTASAYLTFVSLNENGRPRVLPPLILESDVEKRRNREALDRRKVRLAERERESRS